MQAFNPVNHLLDYTLDNSNAAVACVSDADLADLFHVSSYVAASSGVWKHCIEVMILS